MSEGNSTNAQQQRLLKWLQKHKWIDTTTARRELDILHPAGRIKELRGMGHRIVTEWTSVYTSHRSRPHRIAKYVLIKSSGASGSTH